MATARPDKRQVITTKNVIELELSVAEANKLAAGNVPADVRQALAEAIAALPSEP